MEDGDHLQVDEFWSRQVMAAQAASRAVSVLVLAVVAQCRREDRGVDDYQLAWRADRRASTALAKGTDPPAREPARLNTSSRLGLLACSTRRASRYSWRDCPATADRRRSSAWTASGTFLTWIVAISGGILPPNTERR